MIWQGLLVVMGLTIVALVIRERRRHRENLYREIAHSFHKQAYELEREAGAMLDAADRSQVRHVALGYARAASELEHRLLGGPKPVFPRPDGRRWADEQGEKGEGRVGDGG